MSDPTNDTTYKGITLESFIRDTYDQFKEQREEVPKEQEQNKKDEKIRKIKSKQQKKRSKIISRRLKGKNNGQNQVSVVHKS